MALGPRKPRYYVTVLTLGFVLGGFLSSILQRFLPASAAKEFFTWTATPTLGPIHLDLLILTMTIGPIGLQVSLLALVGLILAYLFARSMF
jgi:hypothetical protein